MENIGIKREDIIKIIDKIISHMINNESIEDEELLQLNNVMNTWEWESGVALFAIYLYYKETKQKYLFDYLTLWFEKQITQGVPSKNVNSMCPMLTLTFMYEETGNIQYLNLCKEWLEYAVNKMPRTEEQGIQHIVADKTNNGQLWDDTLYMTVLFITRMGVILKDDIYIQESIRQFLLHLKYLTDPVTGLLFHGWSFVNKNHFAGALWGRGNAWYSAAIVDYLEMIDLSKGVEWVLLSAFERQVKKLAELQDQNGLWFTLLDDCSAYTETSASAGFTYGILKGIRKGYLNKKYMEIAIKGARGVIDQIDENGVVHGVSCGTAMGHTLQHYKDIPQSPMPYGQSLTMLMLVELLKH